MAFLHRRTIVGVGYRIRCCQASNSRNRERRSSCADASGRFPMRGADWPNSQWRSTRRRAKSSIWQREEASLSWALNIAAFWAVTSSGDRTTRAKLNQTHDAVGKAKGNLPTKYQPAGGGGDRADQPDPSWLGELFCRRRLERMLFVCQRLGREEGSGTVDACSGAIRTRLEEME